MPRGVPAAGFRVRGGNPALTAMPVVNAPVQKETDEQIEQKLKDRFDILEMLSKSAIAGDVRALVVSGPAGLGKSYTVEQALGEWDPDAINHTIVKGYVRPTGLYKLLYQFREAGQVIVFDDADAVFFDDVSLNMLKAVCDTTEKRKVSYLAETNLVDEESAERIPRSFEFNGTIIFITNYDFDAMIDKGHKLAPHLQAIVSRAHYIDLAMKTKRDYIVRIKQVVRQGLLANVGLNFVEQKEVVDFITSNADRMRELSLRMALKVGTIRKMGGNWENVARVTCCKNG